MDFANVKLKLDKCLDKLYSKDKDLFFYKTNDPKAAERCLTFRLGYYLQNEFKNYNVDSEYNRHIKNVKVLDDKNVFPDLIIHKRLNDDNNLLWIEI